MNIPGKISNTFVEELFGIINPKDGLRDEITRNPEAVFRVLVEKANFLVEINDIEREISIVLNRLGETNSFIFKTYSIEELVIDVKHYLIAWSTMKDLMTNFINICFDLGIHEKDINFGAVIRNKKVSSSKLLEIIKKHEKLIKVGYTDKQRNDAIHRGKLLDDEINELRSKYNNLYAKKYSILNSSSISDDEFNKENSNLNGELKTLAEAKQMEYKNHFERTMSLNEELVKELAKEVANEMLKQK